MTNRLLTSPLDISSIQDIHIEHKLMDLVTGAWQPSHFEQQNLLDHLTTCTHCLHLLKAIVAVQTEDNLNSFVGQVDNELLTRLTETIQVVDQLEQMHEYIDVLRAQGEVEAQKHFPLLVAHLSKCRACQREVEDIRALLEDAERDELI